MARGDPAFPLEHLVPYFRGGRFAMISVRGRRYGVPALDRQIDRYIAMTDRYTAAAVATYRLRRETERLAKEEGAGSKAP